MDLAPEPTPIGRWVTVVTCGHPFAAEARRLRLEAEGIPTFLDDSRMGTDALYQVATGGIKLQVPIGLVDEARVLLAQSWAIPPMDELDEAWEDLGPASGNLFNQVALKIAHVALLSVTLLLFLLGYLSIVH